MTKTTHDGHCYCGGVTFTVTLDQSDPPRFTAYCHCDSCRRSHAAPLYQVCASWSEQHVVTAGADLINEFQKPGGRIVRAFCTACGTRLYNKFPHWKPDGRELVAWFPNLLSASDLDPMPALLRPKRMANADECVLDEEFLRTWLDERG